MKFPKKMYIDGELVEGSAKISITNPANDQKIADVGAANCADVERALSAARDAFLSWSTTPIAERQQWMVKLRDEVIANEDYLRDCIHHEMGKPWAGTREDFESLCNSLHFYSEEITRMRPENLPDRDGAFDHKLVYQPVGVAVAFIAWNFPLLNLAFKIGPALAAGCPIIIRPSSATPISAYGVGELCHNIGLPKGVVQILATENYAAADALSASPIPALITVIGSTKTGCHVMRTGATTIKRYSMELGGNAPAIVFPDADLDLAADIICALKFNNAGQICVTPNRIFVAASIAADFTAKLVERAGAVRVGFDKTQPIVTGPLIDNRAWKRIKGLVDAALRDGAECLMGGDRPPGMPKGQFFAPTILTGVTEKMQIYKEEIFGPIISLITFDRHEHLAAQANDGPDGGLTAYIFTKTIDLAEQFTQDLRYGEVQINGVKYGIDLPHGGLGQSGMGHDCSHLALHDYLAIKRVTRALTRT